VSIPKDVADRYGIGPGDEIDWIPAGDEIRVVPAGSRRGGELSIEHRLALFDRATARREARRAGEETMAPEPRTGRGWTREELHRRGGAD
jgi:bifunctional DNA-binding transcriptional regulator/antitoxin component of YhaV-PrlF toxin-antitoxin module